MKRVCYTGLTVLMALSLLAGCASMPVFKGSRMKTSGSKSSLSTKKEGLYSQVPAANRAPVREAEFDLKEAGGILGLRLQLLSREAAQVYINGKPALPRRAPATAGRRRRRSSPSAPARRSKPSRLPGPGWSLLPTF